MTRKDKLIVARDVILATIGGALIGTAMTIGTLGPDKAAPVPAVSPTTVVTVTTDGWEPLPLAEAVGLATVVDREDWSGCEIYYGDTTLVRCPDGFTWGS